MPLYIAFQPEIPLGGRRYLKKSRSRQPAEGALRIGFLQSYRKERHRGKARARKVVDAWCLFLWGKEGSFGLRRMVDLHRFGRRRDSRFQRLREKKRST